MQVGGPGMLGTGGSGEDQAESSHLWSPEPSRWLGGFEDSNV